MNRIFYGFLLIFLDFSLTTDTARIELLPDFIGFFLLVGGLKELSAAHEVFGRIVPFATGMGVFSALLYLSDLLGFSVSFGWLNWAVGIVMIALSLYLTYRVIATIRLLEAARTIDLNSEALRRAFIVLAVLNVASYGYIVMPAISMICVIGAIVAGIIFLCALNTCRKRYAGLHDGDGGKTEE